VTVVSYSASEPVKRGVSIAYCNLFDETNSRRYGPYLQTSDTAVEYNGHLPMFPRPALVDHE